MGEIKVKIWKFYLPHTNRKYKSDGIFVVAE